MTLAQHSTDLGSGEVHPLARAALRGLGLPPPVRRDADLQGTDAADHVSNFNPYGGDQARYPLAVPTDLQHRYAAFLRDRAGAADGAPSEDNLGAHHVLLTEGSVSGLDLLVRAFGEPRQDCVVVTPPTFPFYARSARSADVAVVEVPLDGPDLNRVSVDAVTSPRPKLVFLCRPNNPVGTVLDAQLVEAIAAALPDGLVVVDEAYTEFSSVPSVVALLARYPNLVITRTFSKAWGLAGARIGALIATPTIVDTLRVIQLTYGVGGPAQELLDTALADPTRMWDDVARIRQSRDVLATQLRAVPLVRRVYPSEANFLLVQLHAHRPALAALRAASIVVADTARDVPDTIRISVGLPDANDRLVQVLLDVSH